MRSRFWFCRVAARSSCVNEGSRTAGVTVGLDEEEVDVKVGVVSVFRRAVTR